jgi:DNA-directed RNA polymerase specialized sigma subunit
VKFNITNNHSYLAEKIMRSVEDPNNLMLKEEADKARAELMELYMPLAKNLAKKYIGKLSLEDAQSAAYLGMALALRSWNPGKGELSAWIRLYCKNSLLKELDGQSLIKIPQAIAPKYNLFIYYKKQNYTDKQITDKLNITLEELSELMKIPTVTCTDDISIYE